MPELREEELDQLFQQAILMHPSEDELGLFHDGVTDEVTGARIKAHLRRCLDCQERFDTMQHILATFHEVEVPEESLAQLKSLIAATRPKQEQAATIATLIGLVRHVLDNQRRQQKIRLSLRRGARASEGLIWKGKIDDESLTWRFEEDDFGDLKVLFTCAWVELEGHRLLIRIGQITKTALLRLVDEQQLGFAFTISRDEREQLSEGEEMEIESLPPLEAAQP